MWKPGFTGRNGHPPAPGTDARSGSACSQNGNCGRSPAPSAREALSATAALSRTDTVRKTGHERLDVSGLTWRDVRDTLRRGRLRHCHVQVVQQSDMAGHWAMLSLTHTQKELMDIKQGDLRKSIAGPQTGACKWCGRLRSSASRCQVRHWCLTWT